MKAKQIAPFYFLFFHKFYKTVIKICDKTRLLRERERQQAGAIASKCDSEQVRRRASATASGCDDGQEQRRASATTGRSNGERTRRRARATAGGVAASGCDSERVRRRAGAATKIDKPKKERGEALLLPAPFLSVYFMVFRTYRKNLISKNTPYRTKYFAQTAQHPA